jgi:hypothetical protein
MERPTFPVNLIPDTNPGKPNRLNNLKISLLVPFKQLGNLSDLDAATTQQQAAVKFVYRVQI